MVEGRPWVAQLCPMPGCVVHTILSQTSFMVCFIQPLKQEMRLDRGSDTRDYQQSKEMVCDDYPEQRRYSNIENIYPVGKE